MATPEQLKEALAKLDPKNDEHWTTDGMPRIDAIQGFLGGDKTVGRNEIVLAAPALNRSSAPEIVRETPPTGLEQLADAIENGAGSNPPEGADSPKSEEDSDEDTSRAEAVAARESRMNAVAEIDAEISKLKARRERIVAELDQIETFLTRKNDHRHNISEIQRYLESSKRNAAERARLAKAARALAMGAVSHKSPLDIALSSQKRNAKR